MTEPLLAFAAALRRAGLTISPAELADAAAALRYLGADDRETTHAALRACLLRSAEQAPAFDRVFDAFFAARWPAGESDEQRKKRGRGARGPGGKPQRQTQPPRQPNGHGPAREPRPDEAEPKRPADATRAAAAQREQATARAIAASTQAAGARVGARPLWQRPDPVDAAALAREAERLGRLLRTRLGRRWRRARAGRVDLRATVARAGRTGGLPWRLVRRRPRVSEPRLVLLCDVSGSVRRASELLLRLTHALGSRLVGPHAFVFVDRPVEAAHLFTAADVGDALDRLGDLRGLDLQALSDFGHTFIQLLAEHGPLFGPRTTLVVLGDARTNRFDPAVWAVEELAARCARIVWLNPERRGRWYTGDSALAAYEPHLTHLLPAETLDELAAGLDLALRGG